MNKINIKNKPLKIIIFLTSVLVFVVTSSAKAQGKIISIDPDSTAKMEFEDKEQSSGANFNKEYIKSYLTDATQVISSPINEDKSYRLAAQDQGIMPSTESFSMAKMEFEDEENRSEVHLNKEYFKCYLTDAVHIITSPANWDKSDWLTASAVLGTAAGLYAFDNDIERWSQRRRNPSTDSISRFARPFGQEYEIPVLGLFWLYGYGAKDSKAERTSLLGLESFVLSSAFAQVLKYSTHRDRPSESTQNNKWGGPGFSNSHMSCVSGEAAAVFSVATIISEEYKDTGWVPLVSYGVATVASLARINNNAHWTSDVFLGSAIGYFVAKSVLHSHPEKNRFVIMPQSDGDINGLGIGWRF